MGKDSEKNGERGLPKIAVVGIVAVVVAVVAFIIMGHKRRFEPVLAGSSEIDFTLPDLNGKDVNLRDYRGKVVFLNFWATWCKPCQEEMPSMQNLYMGLKGQPFEILAVSVDTDGPETITNYVRKLGLTFPILHDQKVRIKELYKTTGVPETFIIDQNGVIAEKVWGPRDWTIPSSYQTIIDLLKNGPRPRSAYKEAKAAD